MVFDQLGLIRVAIGGVALIGVGVWDVAGIRVVVAEVQVEVNTRDEGVVLAVVGKVGKGWFDWYLTKGTGFIILVVGWEFKWARGCSGLGFSVWFGLG